MTSTPTTNGAQRHDDIFDGAMGRSSRADEQAVLGAMMMASPNSPVPAEIREMLRGPDEGRGVGEHHFTAFAHDLIWKTVIALMDRGEAHDMLAVAAQIEPDKLQRFGGVAYLHTCVESCPTVANGASFARNVANATLLRQLGEAATAQAQHVLASSLNDADEVYDRVRSALDRIAPPARRSNMVAWEVAGPEALEEMERLQLLAESPEGEGDSVFSTGWPDVDRLLGPVAPGSLIIIAARPGVGKSVTGRNIVQHLAMRRNLPAVFFSLEMSRLEISVAMMAAGARIHRNAIKNGTMSDEEWAAAAKYLGATGEAPLEIDDTPGINHAYMDRALAAVTRKYGRAPAAYVIDYLQLAHERGYGSRQEEVGAMSRNHKLLAKRRETVAIAISQLNRNVENRSDKRPQLSDLRESGSLEQDADVVILLDRPDYNDEESPRAGEVDLVIAKNRNGETGTVTLAAQLHFSRFVSMAISA